MIKSMGSDPESAAMAPQTILKMQKNTFIVQNMNF